MAKDEDRTIFTSLGFENTNNDSDYGFYSPQLNTNQINQIGVTQKDWGSMVFNLDTQELQTCTAANAWNNVITDGSEANLADLTVSGDTTLNNLTVTGTADISNLTLPSVITFEDITATGLTRTDNLQVDTISDLLGPLTVYGITTLENNLTVTGSASVQNSLGVSGQASLGNVIIGGSSFGGVISGTAVAGNPWYTVTLGAGAGTGASYLLRGSLISGTFELNTGTSPSGILLATFSMPTASGLLFSAPFGVCFTPANAVTDELNGVYTRWSSLGTGLAGAQFVLETGAGIAPSSVYSWNYTVIGNIAF